MRPLIIYLLAGLVASLPLMAFSCESDLARELSAHEQARDYDAAIAMLQQEVQQNPGNAEAQYHLGRLKMQEGTYDAGLEALEASREASPRYEEEIDFLIDKHHREELVKANEVLETGQAAEAAEHFRNAAFINPSDVRAHRGLGHVLLELGEYADAESAYREAHELEPDHVETLNNLAFLTYERGAYERTVDYSEHALDVGEPQFEVVKRLAYAHVNLGNLTAAEEYLAQALSMEPSNELRRDYALVLFNQEKYQAARTELETLTARDADPELLRALAETQYALDEHRAATRTNATILEQVPGDREALQNLVILHELLEEHDEAREFREQLNQSEEADTEEADEE